MTPSIDRPDARQFRPHSLGVLPASVSCADARQSRALLEIGQSRFLSRSPPEPYSEVRVIHPAIRAPDHRRRRCGSPKSVEVVGAPALFPVLGSSVLALARGPEAPRPREDLNPLPRSKAGDQPSLRRRDSEPPPIPALARGRLHLNRGGASRPVTVVRRRRTPRTLSRRCRWASRRNP